MTKLFKSLAALLLLASPEAAQPVANGPTPALFKVSDADTTIYLFPATAALPPEIDWFRGPVRAAFESSDELAIEVAPPESPEAATATLRRLGAFTATRPLRQLLSKDAGDKLDLTLTEMDMPTSLFDRMEPWFAAVTIGAVCFQGAGADAQISPFAQLQAASAQRGIAVQALESVEAQLTRVDAIDESDQVALLQRNIEACDRAETELAELTTLWSKGDLDGLDQAMRSEPIMARIMPLVADYRNALWADWIAERLKRPGTVFLTGSAANFAGQASVQAELAKRGISVTRVQ